MSDLGSLSQCLVDNDTDARLRARRLRSKALVLSVILEVLLLAAMLVWPLISPGALSARYNVMPTPPYSGGGPKRQSTRTPRSYDEWRRPTVCLAVCAPVFHPQAPATASDAPDIDAGGNTSADSPGLLVNGPGIPGSTGDHPIVPEPSRPEPPPVKPRPMSEGVMAARISGVVHLHAIIGKDGFVRELEAVDGNILLAQAAKAAVQRWRYQPTLLNGEPVEVETYVTVNFLLN
jgi:protein TonB